ncbi:MAG: HD domain-containing protein [Gemmatimonadales bacterium]
MWKQLARLLTAWRGKKRAPPLAELPVWARVGKGRRAHIRRVVTLLEGWADEMDASPQERDRWFRAAWLHDALRDAPLPGAKTHGAAAADRASKYGETDRGVLDAVRYHSVGYAGWDDVGRMLFLADYLEPGRIGRRKQRDKLAQRVPHDRDRVLQEVVALQMRTRLRTGRPIHPLTLEFWNSLTWR